MRWVKIKPYRHQNLEEKPVRLMNGRRKIWMATSSASSSRIRDCDETTGENYNQDGTSQATRPLFCTFSRQPITWVTQCVQFVSTFLSWLACVTPDASAFTGGWDKVPGTNPKPSFRPWMNGVDYTAYLLPEPAVYWHANQNVNEPEGANWLAWGKYSNCMSVEP